MSFCDAIGAHGHNYQAPHTKALRVWFAPKARIGLDSSLSAANLPLRFDKTRGSIYVRRFPKPFLLIDVLTLYAFYFLT